LPTPQLTIAIAETIALSLSRNTRGRFRKTQVGCQMLENHPHHDQGHNTDATRCFPPEKSNTRPESSNMSIAASNPRCCLQFLEGLSPGRNRVQPAHCWASAESTPAAPGAETPNASKDSSIQSQSVNLNLKHRSDPKTETPD